MAAAKLCVTVTGRTLAELRERRDRVTDADLVELRVDTVSDPDAAGALAGRQMPAVFTCRAAWEGGHFKGSEEERKRILREAQRLGAEYVDIEFRAGFLDLVEETRGKGVVLSRHDFDGVPTDLADLNAAMRATGAEVVKIAVTTRRLDESLPLKQLACTAGAKTVVIAMGETGVATRVLAARFGSCWTYAGDAIAPGQLPAATMVDRFGFRRITPQTAVYGVVGRPIAHSISPAIHNAAFQNEKLDAVYIPLAAADFADFLRFADALSLHGASVTAPFKLDAFQVAQELDPASVRVGAVNTLKRRGSGWLACNTDIDGFLAPLASAIALQGARVLVLGAGGAARGVADALATRGASVTISARRREQAAEVARQTGAAVAAWPPQATTWDVIVNATPIGTAPDVEASPLPDAPPTGGLVYDLVYNPPVTRLLRDAGAAGCRTLGGLDMLIAQAARQFEWWTGRKAPERTMRDAAMQALETHN